MRRDFFPKSLLGLDILLSILCERFESEHLPINRFHKTRITSVLNWFAVSSSLFPFFYCAAHEGILVELIAVSRVLAQIKAYRFASIGDVTPIDLVANVHFTVAFLPGRFEGLSFEHGIVAVNAVWFSLLRPPTVVIAEACASKGMLTSDRWVVSYAPRTSVVEATAERAATKLK